MRPNARQVLRLLSISIALLPLSSFGQATNSHAPPNTPNTKRIEGTVARIDGSELLLRVKGGTTETYQLAPSVQLLASRPGQMSDLRSGKSAECTSIYSQGDKVLAGECHIFPDGTHVFPQGHGTADASGTSTINGTIASVRDNVDADKAKGRSVLVEITSREGTTTMTVSSLTGITLVRPADASALMPGARVRGISEQAADGTGVIQSLSVLTSRGTN
jgi:hypothetical protein